MANLNHLEMLQRGVRAWNQWREEHRYDLDAIIVDFSGADLRGVNLSHAKLAMADFRGCRLDEAQFREAFLFAARFDDLELCDVDFAHAHLGGASFVNSRIHGGSMGSADLGQADFTNALLDGVRLIGARMVHTIISGARIRNCEIWSISAWDLQGEPSEQRDLIITPRTVPAITIDNLAVAQFIYLLLNNASIRHIIDTISTKTVLLLGRFAPERKVVLDTIRDALRAHDYVPLVFDFEGPVNRNMTETISTLAHISHFVIADITDPRSVPQELERIVPLLPSVPVVPLLQHNDKSWSMFDDHLDYPWVMDIVTYQSPDDLVSILHDEVIVPARERASVAIRTRKSRMR
jgi:hypothetical protein